MPAIVMEVGLTSGERRSDELLLQRSEKRIDSVEGSRFYSISKVDLKRSRCVAQRSRQDNSTVIRLPDVNGGRLGDSFLQPLQMIC